jgi:hypothetical protein
MWFWCDFCYIKQKFVYCFSWRELCASRFELNLCSRGSKNNVYSPFDKKKCRGSKSRGLTQSALVISALMHISFAVGGYTNTGRGDFCKLSSRVLCVCVSTSSKALPFFRPRYLRRGGRALFPERRPFRCKKGSL